jgi:hypothetical protein
LKTSTALQKNSYTYCCRKIIPQIRRGNDGVGRWDTNLLHFQKKKSSDFNVHQSIFINADTAAVSALACVRNFYWGCPVDPILRELQVTVRNN